MASAESCLWAREIGRGQVCQVRGLPTSQRGLCYGVCALVDNCNHHFTMEGQGSCPTPCLQWEYRALQLLACCRELMGSEFRAESWGNTCNSLSLCWSQCAFLMAACATCRSAVWEIPSLPDSAQHTPQSCPSPLSHGRRASPAGWYSAKFTAHTTPECGGLWKGMNPQCWERQFHKPRLDFLGQKMSYLS